MKTTMMNCCGYGALIFLTLSCLTVESSRPPAFTSTKLPLEDVHFSDGVNYEAGGNGNGNGTTGHHGKRWAVLVAGSSGYENYRHQADVCHAYQVLKKGGLKDENIIVFMYDDIAFHKNNPRPGVIINKPIGDNVYVGVPKDYTGDNVNVHNFYAVILGNKSALTGGSGKVVDSGPNDHIFIYYADHGSSGVLGMPKGGYVYAKDLINVLKKKHDAKAYKKMVIYVEACESGSMFEGLLPNNINIYATTAANTKESSWSIYCPGEDPAHLRGYDTCLGDVYSISWLEDSEKHDLRKETLGQQYEVVRRRTSGESFYYGSHVMQFGNKKCGNDSVSSYIGTNPANDNFTIVQYPSPPSPTRLTQRDADLRHFWHKYHKAPNGSNDKLEAKKRLLAELSYRKHVDNSINHIKMILFGKSNISSVALETVRPTGQPLVDDWDCFKTLVATYEKHCGSLSTYGMKYMRAIANMCNVGVTKEQMAAASMQTCTKKPPT